MKKIICLLAIIASISCFGKHHHRGHRSFKCSPARVTHCSPPKFRHCSPPKHHHHHHRRPRVFHYSSGYTSPGWISGDVSCTPHMVAPMIVPQPVTTYVEDQPVTYVNDVQVDANQTGKQIIQETYHYEHHESHSSTTRIQSFRTINGY